MISQPGLATRMLATFMLLVTTVMLRWFSSSRATASVVVPRFRIIDAVVGDRRRAGPGDGGLRALVHPAPRLIADVGHPGARHRATMHPVQMPGVGQLGQIAADGLQRDVEPLRQIFDHHPAFGAGDVPGFRSVGS